MEKYLVSNSDSICSLLKLMNETLSCAICKEIYTTPVILTFCSHNFCSICIRRYFTIKQECPICGMEASSSNLVPNRIVETLSKNFWNIRKLLEVSSKADSNHLKWKQENASHLSKSAYDVHDVTVENSTLHRNEALEMEQFCHNHSLSEIEQTPVFSLGIKEFCTQSQDFSINSSIPDQTSPSTSEKGFCPKKHISNELDPNLQVSEDSLQTTSEADCPVCGLRVPTNNINRHLDNCLAREEKKSALRKNTPKRMNRNFPSMAKLAYNLLSLRDLRKKLKEIGLPTNGDKIDLKRRHQEFLIKYQSELDKVSPRAPSAVIEEIKREESKRKQLQIKSSFVDKFSPPKPPDIAADNKKHILKHAQQYKELEVLAERSLPRKRRKIYCERKTTEKSSLIDQNKTSQTRKWMSEEIVPDSDPTPLSSNGIVSHSDLNKSSDAVDRNSPELYVDIPEPEIRVSLRSTIAADSQAEEIKDFIDASLSEAY